MKWILILAAAVALLVVSFVVGALLSTIKRAPEPVAARPVVAEPIAPLPSPPTEPVVQPPANTDRGAELTGADLARAERIYVSNCASCHMRSGRGEEHHRKDGIPDFTDAAWLGAHADEELRAAVENGAGPVMPAFGKRLSADEIGLVVGYLKGFPTRATAGSPAKGDGAASHDHASGSGASGGHEGHAGHTH